jgi:hypothetical protein
MADLGRGKEDGESDGTSMSEAHMRQSALASIAAFGATWALRKAMAGAYQRRTGQKPPTRFDRSVPLSQALMWAVMTAVAVSTLQVFLDRGLSRATNTPE